MAQFLVRRVELYRASDSGWFIDGRSWDFLFDRCLFRENAKRGFEARTGFNEGVFLRCFANKNGQGEEDHGGFLFENPANELIAQPRGISFVNTKASINDPVGFNLKGVRGMSFLTPFAEKNKVGFRLRTNDVGAECLGITIQNGWFFNNKDAQVSVEGARHCQIVGSYCAVRKTPGKPEDTVTAPTGIRIGPAALDVDYRYNSFVSDDRDTFDAEFDPTIDDRGSRSRRHGIVQPQDLGTVTGTHQGDIAIDDGTNTETSYTLCTWTGTAWSPMDGSDPIVPSA
jgi:hypothetical protein